VLAIQSGGASNTVTQAIHRREKEVEQLTHEIDRARQMVMVQPRIEPRVKVDDVRSGSSFASQLTVAGLPLRKIQVPREPHVDALRAPHARSWRGDDRRTRSRVAARQPSTVRSRRGWVLPQRAAPTLCQIPLRADMKGAKRTEWRPREV
jgi:hypothetical protein